MPVELKIAIISAAAALFGSAIGGVVSYLTTYRLNIHQWRKERIDREIDRKEKLYSDFMSEVSHLIMLSVTPKKFEPECCSKLIALLTQIKLFSSEEVMEAADAVAKKTLKSFAEKTSEPPEEEDSKKSDLPAIRFSKACRQELATLRNS
jgi:hypothetical protein